MPATLADVHAAGAVDVDVDLLAGQVSWRGLDGALVARGRCAAVLVWSPNARSVAWSMHEPDLVAGGAPVLPIPWTVDTQLGAVGAAAAERLARAAAEEARWPELLRLGEGSQVRFVAVDQVEVLGPPVSPTRRLRALAASLRRGGDPVEVAGRVRELAEQTRQRALELGGLESVVLTGVADRLSRLADGTDIDPERAHAELELTAQALFEAPAPDLGEPDGLLGALGVWEKHRDEALRDALVDGVAALAASPDVKERAARLLAGATTLGMPFEVLADLLQQLAPRGRASAPLWRALAAAAPARAQLVTLYNLGHSLRTGAGAPEAAVALFARAVELDPGDAELRFELGSARRDLGDHEGALQAWVEACELDPAMPGPWAALGLLLLSEGRAGEARQALARLVELDPSPAHREAYARAVAACGHGDEAADGGAAQPPKSSE